MYQMRRIPRLIRDARPLVAAWRGKIVYVDGKPVVRDPLRFIVRALVEPITSQKQNLLPEGDRLTERYTLYQDWTQSQPVDAPDLRAGDRSLSLAVNDKVRLFGQPFIVEEAKFWGSYVEVTVTRVDVGNKQPIDFPPLPEEDE
jgi:hypothetical protein